MKDFIKNIIKKIYTKESSDIIAGERVSEASRFYSGIPDDIRKMSLGCGNPVDFIQGKKYSRILDLGCGMGVDIIYLTKKIQYDLICGIELTDAMAQSASQNLREFNRVFVVQADMENLPFPDNYFDLIVSNAAIHLVPDKKNVFEECRRVMKKSGEMVVSDLMIDTELPDIMSQEYYNSDGLFLFGGLKPEHEYFDCAYQAGFFSGEVIERKEFRPAETISKLLHDKGLVKNREEFEKQIEHIHFYSNIISFSAQKPDSLIQAPCICGKTEDMNYVNPMNVTVSPVLKDDFLNGIINTAVCTSCGMEVFPPDPLLYHDMNARIMLHIFPLFLEQHKADIESMVQSKINDDDMIGYTHKIIFGIESAKQYIRSLK